MSAISKFIKDKVLLGDRSYSVGMFENQTVTYNQTEDQEVYVKQAKKQKKQDFNANRKVKRGEGLWTKLRKEVK